MFRRIADFIFPLRYESTRHSVSLTSCNLSIDRLMSSGWYIIEFVAVGANSYCANLEISCGEPVCNINLNGKSGRVVKRLIFVERNSKRISIEWKESDIQSIELLVVKPVTKKFARNRMLKKVIANRCYASSMSRGELWDYLKGDMFQLKEDYDSCFGLKGSTIANYEDWLGSVSSKPENAIVESGPLISVVIPVYKPKREYLQQAFESVFSQTYPNFEVCVADDGSGVDWLRQYFLELKKCHTNFHYTLRNQNGHISAATNSALELVSGQYVAFMDQDDLLSPHALNEFALAIVSNPKLKLIYSDEDKIDETGRRFEGHFKPDFSPNLLLGQNYISHMSCINTILVRELGGLRVGLEGAQDHDLLLRALPYLDCENVHHIPKILYHWRAIEGSTALSLDEKKYTELAAYRAVSDYLSSQEIDAEVKLGRAPNTLKVDWKLKEFPQVSLLIPTKDRLDVLKPCIDSILGITDYPNYEVIVLDNGSVEEETSEYLTQLVELDSRVRVIGVPGEFNFSRINNIGVRSARGEYIALVNNDIEAIHSDWLTEMISQAVSTEAGCIGAKLLYPDGSIQHGGVILGIGGVAGHSHLYKDGVDSGYFQKMDLVHEVSAVTAACLVVKKSIYLGVGGLDESLKVAFNDVDFCLKVREAGYTNIFTPYATLYHHESISRGYEDTPEKQKRFNREADYMKEKWGATLYSDPYYNSNFDLKAESYHLSTY
jgi:glycosyltransferase involved in cell wall biosynthesis